MMTIRNMIWRSICVYSFFIFLFPILFLKQQRFIQFATTSQDEMSCLAQTKKQRNKNRKTKARHKQNKTSKRRYHNHQYIEKNYPKHHSNRKHHLWPIPSNNKTTEIKVKIFLHHQILSTQNWGYLKRKKIN